MSSWAELVNSDGSDEHLELCAAAMAEIQQVERAKNLRQIAAEVEKMADEGFSLVAIAFRLDAAGKYLSSLREGMSLAEAVQKAKEAYDS